MQETSSLKMTLNLDKNKSVLVHAWKEVLDERNPIDW